jgi:hypothetical protein
MTNTERVVETAAAASTQRLDKEMMENVMEIVVEQLALTGNVLSVNKLGTAAALADADTLNVAYTLWKAVVQRLVCAQVSRELEQRRLLPVTIRTLSALICDALSVYKQS